MSRVWYLLKNIQSSDTTICSGKTTIQADPAKKDNFKLAAAFFMTICPPPKAQTNNHRISAVKQNCNKKGKVRIGPKTGVEICFYRRDEWNELSWEQQKEVKDASRQELKKRQKMMQDQSRITLPRLQQLKHILKSKCRNDKLCEDGKTPLPPKPSGNPLKPPTGFTQQGR